MDEDVTKPDVTEDGPGKDGGRAQPAEDRLGLRRGSLTAWQPPPPRVMWAPPPESYPKRRTPHAPWRIAFWAVMILGAVMVVACVVLSAAVALAVIEGRNPAAAIRPLAAVAGAISLLIGAPALLRWRSRAADLTDWGINRGMVRSDDVGRIARLNKRVYLYGGLAATVGGIVSIAVALE